MKKFFKYATLALALALCLGAAAFTAGCKEKSDDKYIIKLVYDDGSAVTDTSIEVQCCLADFNHETVVCYNKQNISSDGTVTMDSADWEELTEGYSYHIFLPGLDEGSYEGVYATKPGTYTIKIKK